jgi:hypothetical protein
MTSFEKHSNKAWKFPRSTQLDTIGLGSCVEGRQMALAEKSPDAINNAILIAGVPLGFWLPSAITRQSWGDMATKTDFIIAALPFMIGALRVCFFYLRLPYPSRYGHRQSFLDGPLIVRTHWRDMAAMGIGACAAIVLFFI